MNRTAAYYRLRELPALFRGGDLTRRQGMTSATASQSLWRWKHAGLVAALGGRSDVYANLVVAPQPDWDTAVRMAMPSALIIGIEALRRAGWTTQIPVLPDVAVRVDRPHFLKIEPFAVTPRPATWFECVRPGIDDGSSAAPTLSPAWALADLLANEGWCTCGLAPEDVEFDEATDQDRFQWVAACEAFGLEACELEDAGRTLSPASSRSTCEMR